MKLFPSPLKKLLVDISLGFIPVLIFTAILAANIPSTISRFFALYSFPYFILVVCLYYFAFRLQGQYAWLSGAGLTALLFSAVIAYLWNSGYSNDKLIGGVLPYRDGFYYYNGARLLLDGHQFPAYSYGAAWRPLFTSFISSLLLLTNYNLQWTLAVLAGILAVSCYLSAWFLRNWLGAAAAAVYMTLLYIFIQPMIGILYTEQLGLSLGCLAFILIGKSVKNSRFAYFLAGSVVLTVALSVRAGAFFALPCLALWAGWFFRGRSRFNVRLAALVLLVMGVTFLTVNTLFGRLVVEKGNIAFGNFSYTIYGQVVGGAGYNAAYQQLGLRNQALIYRAAWQFFLKHPLSFFIGAAKAYRDFFLPDQGIFGYISPGGQSVWDLILWGVLLCLTLLGLYKIIRSLKTPFYSLLLAVFIGLLLSIPFLPPIDGGVRIYAATNPLFFAIPVVALGALVVPERAGEADRPQLSILAFGLSCLLILASAILPAIVQKTSTEPVAALPACPTDQVAYLVELYPGSYVDLLPGDTAGCGRVPSLCLPDFQANSEMVDTSDAMVYQAIVDFAQKVPDGIRLFPAHNILDRRFYLFMGPVNLLQPGGRRVLFSGCASGLDMEKRAGIYRIETVLEP